MFESQSTTFTRKRPPSHWSPVLRSVSLGMGAGRNNTWKCVKPFESHQLILLSEYRGSTLSRIIAENDGGALESLAREGIDSVSVERVTPYGR
jgi:hypothetical protein